MPDPFRHMATEIESLLPKVMDLLLDTVCVVDAEGRFVYVNAACERLFGYGQEELIGRNMIELVHPDDRERTLAAAADIMHDQPHIHFENRYVRKDGRVVYIMWSARWSAPDRLRLAVARDVTALKRTQTLERALYRISEAAYTADDLDALYPGIHEVIGELLSADDFRVALYEASDQTLSWPYSSGEPAPAPRSLDDDTRIATVIRTGRALLSSRDGHAATVTGDAPLPPGGADWLGVPLVFHGDVMGALVLQGQHDGLRYTEEDRDLLQFVSEQVASAIQRKQAEHRLHHMAHHDSLTALPNRALFHDRLDTALARARRDHEHLALLYLDLDEFKQINDSCGHEIGDLLLREVATRLANCVRESDTVGRLGGDEFSVLLTNIRGPGAADVVVGKIRAAIGAPFALREHTLRISASIGTAVYPEHGTGREQLFRHADRGMYSAKHTTETE